MSLDFDHAAPHLSLLPVVRPASIALRAPLRQPEREVAPEDTKAFEMLLGIARRITEPVPARLLAAHVLRIHAGDGWVVQRAAFEALLRRVERARADALRVAIRPARGEPFGRYSTRRKGRGARPWATAVLALEPLRASCDCPDYLRGGLGVCKHVFAALEEIARRPAVWARAEARVGEGLDGDQGWVLDWDPVRPLLGADPWWSRLRARNSGRRPAFARGWRLRHDGRLEPGRLSRPKEVEMLRACARYAERRPERVSPAARAMIDGAREQLDASPEASRRRSLGTLRTLAKPLYPYQRDGVRRFLTAERLLLADDMGLGKTAQAIAACHALRRGGLVRRGLLIVPAALKSQWHREWLAFTDVPATVVEGSPAERRALYEATREGFLIVNYELLLRDGEALRAWDAGVVVLDEAQRIKNWSTRTARAVKSLRPRYRLALTGTPLENRLPELASIMDWVDERALEPKWRLPAVHGGVGCAQHLGTLRARLAHCFLRRRRADILSELPPRSDTTVPVPLTRRQAVTHDRLDREVAKLVSKAKRGRPLSPAERLRLMAFLTQQRIVANGSAQAEFESVWPQIEHRAPTEAQLAELASPKLAALREIVRSLVLEQGRRVVVFSQWRRMLRLARWATRDLIEDAGFRSVCFTGAESLRARDRSIVELHDDPATRVLFASDAGGVGLNLQRAATACVNLELPWNPAVLEQRVARIHRLGQDAPIDVINLMTKGSIEERIESLVGAKRALFEGLFDSDADSVEVESVPIEQLASQWEALPDMHPEASSADAGPHARRAAPAGAEGDDDEPGDDEVGDGAREDDPRDDLRAADREGADREGADREGADREGADREGADDVRDHDGATDDAHDDDDVYDHGDGTDDATDEVTEGHLSTVIDRDGTGGTHEDADGDDPTDPDASGVTDDVGEHDVTDDVSRRSHGPRSLDGPAVEQMFAALRVESRSDGSVRIDAPREVAATLAALMRGLGSLLGAPA